MITLQLVIELQRSHAIPSNTFVRSEDIATGEKANVKM